MNQLLIILKREITVKVKSKGFYFFVFLSPILFLIPIVSTMFGGANADSHKNLVAINSESPIIADTIDYRGLKFFNLNNKADSAISGVIGTLDVKDNDIQNHNSKTPLKFRVNEKDLLISKEKIKDIESFINQEIIYKKSKTNGIADSVAYDISNLKNVYPVINQNKIEDSKKLASSLAFVLSMLVYITFILFNNSMLKSVVEEKASKLAEVLSIFVKPINIMTGKIIGQGLASLIQLVLWIFVFFIYLKILSLVETHFILKGNNVDNISFLQSSLEGLKKLPLVNIAVYLPVFFILGIMLNGALTTIIAVYSSRKNSNHLMFIGNITNLLAIYFGVFAATNPESTVTKISYYIPFVSYLTIPTTLPFGVPVGTIIISMSILFISVCVLFYLSAITYKKSFQL